MNGRKTKRGIIVISIMAAIFMAGFGIPAATRGIGDAAQNKAAEECLVDKALKISNIQEMEVVLVSEDTLKYLGNGNREALYQIGSMTKAFTALGILQLEKQGALQQTDAVSKYLNGFAAQYNGVAADITINQLLYQTSGYTNSEMLYPSAGNNMSLSEWVDSISGLELQNPPGHKYAYSNVNYNLLGRIIEVVSGQTYKDYMEQYIIEPLGLQHTFCGVPLNNTAVLKGTRQGYLINFPYKRSISEGQIPAGYFYSNIEDMARWIQIQLGQVEISGDLADAVLGVQQLAAEKYFGGWEPFSPGAFGHSGGTAGFSSRIVFNPKKQIGVCVLANQNAAATVDSLCNALYSREENPDIPYDIWRILDFAFTGISILGLASTVFFLRAKCRRKFVYPLITGILFTVTLAILIVFPLAFAASWGMILRIWAPYSMTGGIVLLCLSVIVGSVRCIREGVLRRRYKC